ncbi:MAG: hypothetical protein JNK05_38110 [Myxococcales bacterium]|nr:hypothetical protein [Myxococcales bacterium]
MKGLPRYARLTRALALSCAATSFATACESSRDAAPNTFSTSTTTSGDRAAVERDASAGDSGVAVAEAPPPSRVADVSNGAPCSTVGMTRTFGDPQDQTHCTCTANGSITRWNCYTDSMTIEGPLPPPELLA